MEMKITNENFEKEVLQADKTVLADFYADWCGPCKMLSPVLHEIAEENADTVKVVKINVDEQPQLAGRFQVSSIPLRKTCQMRSTGNLESSGKLRLFIDIDFYYFDSIGIFFGDFMQHRRKHFARSAPIRVKIRQYGFICL